MLSIVLRTQGVYYVVTGLWPLVSLRTFEWVTGPKTDDWLVYTVGLLTGVIGVGLVMAGGRERPPDPTVFIGLGTALSFATVDAIFALSGRIRLIYLGDAAVEIAFAVLLAVYWLRSRSRPRG